MLPGLLIASGLALAEPGYTSSGWRASAGPVHYHWIPDLALTAASLGGLAALYQVGPRAPGGVAEPSGIDLPPAPRWSEGAAAWSDFFGHAGKYYGANVPVLSALGVGVFGGLRNRHAGAGAVYSLVAIEAVSLDLVVTEVIKVAVSRPRPYTALAFQQAEPEAYAGDTIQEDLSEEGHHDAYKSFPSGHTSSAGAATFAVATLVWRDLSSRGAKPWVAGAAYGGAAALTATAGWLRVEAGFHHPTDVIAGGLLGAAIGTGTAWLHTTGGLGPTATLTGEGAPVLSFQGTW